MPNVLHNHLHRDGGVEHDVHAICGRRELPDQMRCSAVKSEQMGRDDSRSRGDPDVRRDGDDEILTAVLELDDLP